MFLNKIRVFLLINIHIVILLTSTENLKAKELKIITGIAKVIDGDTILIKIIFVVRFLLIGSKKKLTINL
jgi:endonuclease YncB( thermonuclease family)